MNNIDALKRDAYLTEKKQKRHILSAQLDSASSCIKQYLISQGADPKAFLNTKDIKSYQNFPSTLDVDALSKEAIEEMKKTIQMLDEILDS